MRCYAMRERSAAIKRRKGNTCNRNAMEHTLLEKQSKFPRYNMKSRGKRDTTHEIFPVVSRFPRYISCYIAESRLPLGQC